jgi:hypothetical protein
MLESRASEVGCECEVSVTSETIDAIADRSSATKNAGPVTIRKARTTRKLKSERLVSAPSTVQAVARSATPSKINNPNVRSRLEKGIFELQGLHDLLLSSEVDPDVLTDLRDALNRVRNTAWVAQQYVIRQESDGSSTRVRSLLAGERIRAAYQLCQALTDDLEGTDIDFQRGSLLQLDEVTTILTKRLRGVISRLG